jgi:hypothetical protein
VKSRKVFLELRSLTATDGRITGLIEFLINPEKSTGKSVARWLKKKNSINACGVTFGLWWGIPLKRHFGIRLSGKENGEMRGEI